MAMRLSSSVQSAAANHWKVSYQITQLLTDGEVKNPFAAVLRVLIQHLQFDIGALWLVNDLRLWLECAEFVSVPRGLSQYVFVERKH